MRKSLAIFSILLISACVGPNPTDNPDIGISAPQSVIAADRAQNQLVQQDGVYSALFASAADNAIIFAPEPMRAKPWLKLQSPRKDVTWQPHSIFLSCDEKTAVTTGAIKWGEIDGYYTTVWRYFYTSGGGEWRWLLSHGDMLNSPRKAPKSILTETASCEGKAPATINAPAVGVKLRQGLSDDQSLSFTWKYFPDKSRQLVVKLWNGQQNITVLTDYIAEES